MLTNYDAKAVADLMGIAFLREPDTDPSQAATPAQGAKGSKPATRTTPGKFAFKVADGMVHMVEIRADKSYGEFSKGKRSSNHSHVFKKGLRWPPSPILIERAVERGLPRLALRRVAEQLAGGDKAKIALLEWGVVPKTTLERREEQLSPQESERTERVARLLVHARRALGTEAEARDFMTKPHPRLDGRSPIDAAKTDLGTRRVEQILNALEYGLAL